MPFLGNTGVENEQEEKSGKFLFIPSHALVVVVSVVAVINIASAEFVNNSISNTENGPNFSSIMESLIPDEKDLVKRQQVKDDNDNEEIGELSRLQDPNNQDPASQDIPNQDLDTNTDQVGGSINGADVEKINPTVDNGLVPSDQNQSTSDSLANISDFLKNKEGEGPVDGDFTLWTSWSSCPNACGRTALRSRERYCTNPAPASGGKNCEGPRFQLKLCKIKHCSVDGSYSPWSRWTSCSQKCGQGMKKRRRYCDSPKPANGGQRCKGAKKQVKPCYGKVCQNQDSIVDIDPKTVCGYNPCMVAKCILLPYATCVSDFKCRPVFFDSEERKVSQCTGDNLYLNVEPQAVCRFNPCKYTTCLQGAAAKCVVNTRCHPVFLDAFGKTIKCKGVFKVPARYICGYDPCSGAVCKTDPTARCLVEHTCKALFVNSFNQKMNRCKARHHIMKEEDDGEDQLNDEDNNEDDDGTRISKLMNSKLSASDKEIDDDDDDGARLSKLMSSKLRASKKDEDDDDDDDDDGVRISKLMNSKLSDKDDNDDDEKVDDSDRDSGDDSEKDVRSKLPSRFKLPTRRNFEKDKKNRFGRVHTKHGHVHPKHVKSNHKRWLKNAS
ncbi:hypothetical protein OS493_015957 [Desmophyllum pertusum]|uniref:Uncharacterized protein n=1 Tax=Desmophyllum pertusum TaxID=174260 RepID=A0A9X0CF78_9CNID|nr:hypothetical protein OS493_015957 [Desmophyllum pertusum]